MAEQNLLTEKIISILRGCDMQQHRNIRVMTVNEDRVRNILNSNEYFSGLAAQQQEALTREMQKAEAARVAAAKAAAEAAAKAKADAAAEHQKRIEGNLLALKLRKEKFEAIKATEKKNKEAAEKAQENLKTKKTK